MSASEKVDAWMPLWIGSYLADTMDLTRDEHGGYLLLLIAYWRNKGPLPDDDKKLSTITRCQGRAEWRRLRGTLEPFFAVADGLWIHGRADQELAKAGKRKAEAVNKAKSGAEARWHRNKQLDADASSIATSNAPSMPEALPEDMLKQSPTPTPSSSVAKATEAGASSSPDGVEDEKSTAPKERRSDPRRDLWNAALDVLGKGGCEVNATARAFMGKLVKDYTFEVVRDAVAVAVTEQPVDARGFLKATCIRLKGDKKVGDPTAPHEADLVRQLNEASARDTKPTPEEAAARRQAAADIKARRAREALTPKAPETTE